MCGRILRGVGLYGGVEKAIDQTIKIGGNAFRIVGVVARQDDDELESAEATISSGCPTAVPRR